MDPLTHILSGAILSRAGLYQKWGKAATIALVSGAIIPDVDYITLRLAGPIAYLKYHRGFTHSIIGAISIAIVLAFIIHILFKDAKTKIAYPNLFYLVFLGIIMHIFLDLITSYGTQIFFPFDTFRYSLDLVFIIDPYFSLIFILPLILWIFKKERARRFAITAILLMFIYLAFVYAFKNIAANIAEAEIKKRGVNLSRIEAIPMPFSPFKWSIFIEDEKRFYQMNIDIVRNKIDTLPFDKMPKDNEILKKADSLEIVKVYKWFARFPVAALKKEGDDYVIEYYDIRFNSIPPRKPFLLKVILDKNGLFKEGELFFHSIRP